jgi:hypothetical protein
MASASETTFRLFFMVAPLSDRRAAGVRSVGARIVPRKRGDGQPWLSILVDGRIAALSPSCNSRAERFVKTITHEALNHFVFFGERHLRYVVKELMAHCYTERFHQGLGGQLIERAAGSANDIDAKGNVVCRSRLDGMLSFYYREAA